MPGFQYDTLTVYGLYREPVCQVGDSNQWWPIPTCVTLRHRVYQWVASVVDQILIGVPNNSETKDPLARAEPDPGDSGPASESRSTFPGTQPASRRIHSLIYYKGLNTQTPSAVRFSATSTTPWIDWYASGRSSMRSCGPA